MSTNRNLKSLLLFCLCINLLYSVNAQNGQVKKTQPKPAPAAGKGVAKPAAKQGGDPGGINKSTPKPGNPALADKNKYKNVGRAPGKYAIKVKLKGFSNVAIYLADNFGDKQYFRDTCFLDATGTGTFKGTPKLQRGMYMIVFPKMDGYYELPITDDQEFYFEADTTMDESKITITGSLENEAFVIYQKNRAINGKKRWDLDNNIKMAKTANNEILAAQLKLQKDSLDKTDIQFRENYMSKYPNHFLTKLFTSFKSIKIPTNPNPLDSMFEYRYYRDHYWDNIDFHESGLIRAPQGMLTAKLNEFIDRISFQDPDSLVQAVDFAIGKTVPFTETQKYFIQFITNKFQDRKIMCQDNVTIHLINKYYCQGQAWWYDDTAGKRKMCEEAKKALPTLCGKTAPDLNMADTAGKMHRLYENLGKFTIVFFYDPTCSHCKEVIPVVNAVFQKHKMHGIKVYAVSTENKYDEWREMMRKRPELGEWINVCRTDRYYPWPLNKYDYNIVANPTIFIIDENGRILGKKIDEHQLEFFLESLMFEKGLIDTKPIPPTEKIEEKHEDKPDQDSNAPATGSDH